MVIDSVLLPFCASLLVERWSWPTGHPNQLGVLSAIATVLAVAGMAALLARPARRGLLVTAAVVLGALACCTIVALVGSQSRGGWLAALVGLMTIIALGPSPRARWCAGAAVACLLLAVALFPGGAERVASMSKPAADESWMSRIELWRAALILIHDHPSGIGGGMFSTTYAAWFQAPDDHFFVRFVVNEPLHLLCELGLWMSLAYGALIAACLACWRVGLRQRSVMRIGIGAALSTYLMASFFSCFLVVTPMLGLVLAPLVIAGVVVAGLPLMRAGGTRRDDALFLIVSAVGTTAVIAGVTVLLSMVAAKSDPVRSWAEGIDMPRGMRLGGVPRSAAPSGTVMVLADDREKPVEVSRFVLRPAITSGRCAALAADIDPARWSHMPRPLTVVAMGTGCAAVSEWCRAGLVPDRVVLIDADPDEGAQAVSGLRCPVLGIRGSRTAFGSDLTTPAWFAADALPPGSRWLAPQWGRTWSRRFPTLMPEVDAWLASLPQNVVP